MIYPLTNQSKIAASCMYDYLRLREKAEDRSDTHFAPHEQFCSDRQAIANKIWTLERGISLELDGDRIGKRPSAGRGDMARRQPTRANRDA